MVRIAAAAYRCEFLGSWSAYENKIAAWVGEAAGQGAELLVFPEWGGIELATLESRAVAGDLARCIDAETEWPPRADALHARLAAENGVHICAASALVRRDGVVLNKRHWPEQADGRLDALERVDLCVAREGA